MRTNQEFNISLLRAYTSTEQDLFVLMSKGHWFDCADSVFTEWFKVVHYIVLWLPHFTSSYFSTCIYNVISGSSSKSLPVCIKNLSKDLHLLLRKNVEQNIWIKTKIFPMLPAKSCLLEPDNTKMYLLNDQLELVTCDSVTGCNRIMHNVSKNTHFCRLQEKELCCCFLIFTVEPTAFIRQSNFIFVFSNINSVNYLAFWRNLWKFSTSISSTEVSKTFIFIYYF